MSNAQKHQTTAPEPFALYRKIGSTHYKVGIHFSQNAKETLDDKVRRLLKNDLLTASGDAKLDSLQAGWLSERKII